MKSMTNLLLLGLNSLKEAPTEKLQELKKSARVDFEVAFKGLCALEGEVRDVPYYWEQTINEVCRHNVPFDEAHAHDLSHMGDHVREIETPHFSQERWEYLIGSFGRAMRLSCQIYLAADEIIKKR